MSAGAGKIYVGGSLVAFAFAREPVTERMSQIREKPTSFGQRHGKPTRSLSIQAYRYDRLAMVWAC